MVEHKSLLAKAFILTALIFVIGVILGFYLDSLRSDEALFNLRNSELDAQSYLSEQEFFEEFGGYDCTIAGKRIDDLSKQLGELGPYIVNFERKNLFKQEDYEYLLRKYFLMEVRTYTQFTKLNRECGLNKTLILYFFDPEDSVSERQGKILDVLVRESIGLSVFSINFNYGEDPLLEAIKIYYGVNETPTLIIQGKKVEGFTSLEKIEEIAGANQ
ncbi:MAG TPA: hypothetical protein VJB94_04045 [Candidatus Nanoarchaeia archaeon]|nr:hypothetical protein [Candidatus Nanoarchaeia archaeon]